MVVDLGCPDTVVSGTLTLERGAVWEVHPAEGYSLYASPSVRRVHLPFYCANISDWLHLRWGLSPRIHVLTTRGWSVYTWKRVQR